MLVLVVLRLPHLCWHDVGDDNRVAVARLMPEIVDHMRRVRCPRRANFGCRAQRNRLQLVDGVQPFTAIDGFNLRHHSSNTSRKSPPAAHRLDVFVDLRRINLDVNLLGVGRVGFRLPVTRSSSACRRRAAGRPPGWYGSPTLLRACHHAEVERMRRRKRAQAQQRHRHRDAGTLGKIAHLAHRPETMMPCPARITAASSYGLTRAPAHIPRSGDRSGR